MAKVVQSRGVPDSMHRRLRMHAARYGLSPSGCQLAEIIEIAAMPAPEGMRARPGSRRAVTSSESAAGMVRRERGWA